jgi:DNA polymerase elongation subunit (family B)
MCAERHYRFLKEPKGVLPTILQNLLDARKHTRSQMKDITKHLKDCKDVNKIKELNLLYNVLDKRQLAYKVSANSAYGALGVRKGYLPFMPGAMCTTYMGRINIELVAKTIPEKYGGELVYGDTDSNYIHFPHLKTAKETWEYSEHVAAEITKMFPKPISLAYEEVIYWSFFILTKKRYMYNSCDKEGNISKKVGKKGVLLARRDNSPFIRKLYEAVIMKVFERESKEHVIGFVLDEINKLCSNAFEYKDFVVTKSVGDIAGLSATEVTDEKGVTKMKVGDYKVPSLLKDKDERDAQLLKKDAVDVKDFYLKSLPGQVQLAERMRRRGMRVDPGSRLEYVIIESEDNFKDKTSEKMESVDYFANHRDVLKIDFMYYLKLLTNPMDQVLITAYKEKDFTLKQYKFRIQRCKVLEELRNLFRPKLKFIE